MKNLSIWISGGGSGVGRELAWQLAETGNKVFISGRSIDKLAEVASHCPENITPMPCDVRDYESVNNALAQVNGGSLQLDGIILTAGICIYLDLPELPLDDISKVMDTNFMGTVNCCKAALPYLYQAQQQGRPKPFVAGICSMSTYAGFTRAEAYGTSKAAMEYFLKSLRADIEDKVDVSIIQLGFVKTPMTEQNDFPMPFLLEADTAAQQILKKLDSHARTIVVPRRLHWVLKTLSLFDSVWYGWFIPRMRRAGTEGKKQ